MQKVIRDFIFTVILQEFKSYIMSHIIWLILIGLTLFGPLIPYPSANFWIFIFILGLRRYDFEPFIYWRDKYYCNFQDRLINLTHKSELWFRVAKQKNNHLYELQFLGKCRVYLRRHFQCKFCTACYLKRFKIIYSKSFKNFKIDYFWLLNIIWFDKILIASCLELDFDDYDS